MVNDKRIIPDTDLNQSIRVVSVNETPGEFLRVQVELQNTTQSPRGFKYKFEWFDEHGMLVNTLASTYIPRQIEGKESMFIGATAPTPNIKDFRVKFIRQ